MFNENSFTSSINICKLNNLQKSDNLTYTKVNLSNEFNIPYPNTKIKFSGKRTNLVTITDSLGQTAIDIVQGDTIVVSCVINNKENINLIT